MNDSLELSYQAQNGLVINIFNNALWRELINRAGENIFNENIKVQVITPWGFEVTEDRRYLSKHLRRFYCYLGIPPEFEGIAGEKTQIAQKFTDNLLQLLSTINTKILEEFVVLIEQHRLKLLQPNNYQCRINDKLLDVQVRFTHNILDDYANAIIASLDAIDSEKGEVTNYRTNRVTRWRMYQLYIISECLFGHLIPSFSHEEKKMYHSIFILVDNMIQVFYSPDEMNMLMNPWEHYVIDHLIKSRVKQMKMAVVSSNKDENMILKPHAYHIEDELCLEISKQNYHYALDKVKQSYLNFV